MVKDWVLVNINCVYCEWSGYWMNSNLLKIHLTPACAQVLVFNCAITQSVMFTLILRLCFNLLASFEETPQGYR